jgi:hypothetical protein
MPDQPTVFTMKDILSEIVSSDSGVDCGDLHGSDQEEARQLVERGLVVVNQTGWFGPRFVATQEGRRLFRQLRR